MEMDEIMHTHKSDPYYTRTFYLDVTSFQTQTDCDKIINIIKEQYESRKNFNLVIETRNLHVRNISFQCLYIFSSFLNSLKKNKYHYLKKTLIKIYNTYCYELLYFMFTYLSSPVAIVEVILYKNCELSNKIVGDIQFSNIEKIKQYFP
jgi:hypothetical protein